MQGMADSPVLLLLVLLLALLFAVGFWCLMLTVMSRLSGWQRLASRFATHRVPTGRRFGWQSARLGWVGYNNALVLHAASDGVFMQPWRIFRLAHPQLLIPWTELLHGQRRRFLGLDLVHFQLASLPGFKLALPTKVLQGHAVQYAG